MGLPTSGENARVHEGGHAKVGQHKDEDDAIVKWDDGGDCAGQPRAPASGQNQSILQ